MQLSQLASALQTLDTQVNAVKASFDAYIASLANADLPDDAATALTQLQTDMAALGTDVTAATTPPATTSPAPTGGTSAPATGTGGTSAPATTGSGTTGD